MPISLDDIPDLDDMSSDDDLPSFGGPAKKKAPAKKAASSGWSGSTSTKGGGGKTRAQLLKEGKEVKSAREESAAKPKPAKKTPSYMVNPGKKDVLDRLTNTTGYTGASKKRFEAGKGKGLKGRDMGNEQKVSDLSQITRSGVARPAAKQAYVDEESSEDERAPVDLRENDMENVVEELDADDREALRAQFEQELALEDFGLPDYKNGDFGKAAKKKTRVVSKGDWKASTNAKTGTKKTRAQLLREGKDVKSAREEADAATRPTPARRGSIARNCTVADCTGKSVGKRGYCAKCQNAHNERLQNTMATAEANAAARAAANKPAVSKEKCAGCRKGLSGDTVAALGRKWCAPCFCCQGCGCDFPTGKFVNIKNKPYCRTCAATAAGSAAGAQSAAGGSNRCKACGKAVVGNGVEALGSVWHPQCFVCTNCAKPFPGGKFSTVKGQPFCNQACFEEHLGL